GSCSWISGHGFTITWKTPCLWKGPPALKRFLCQRLTNCIGMIMVNRIFDLYDELEKQRIMLSFKGDLSPDLISAILNLVEQKLVVTEPEHRIRKRVFNVVMECLQNLYHHNRSGTITKPEPAAPDERQGVVMIAH